MVMCGVRFMAETCKVLCPEQRVYLPDPTAGCPMAEQMNLTLVKEKRKKYLGCAVVAYINTTSALKTVCDACVTSSSAVKICKAPDAKEIFFLPDQNLARHAAQRVPGKFCKGAAPTTAL